MIIIETFQRGCSPRYRPTGTNAHYQDRHFMIRSHASRKVPLALRLVLDRS